MQESIRFKDYIEKENVLRLKWFKKNEEKLQYLATRPNIRTVPPETLEKYDQIRKELIQNERLVKKKPPEIIPDCEGATKSVMRPVDPKLTSILYEGRHSAYVQ